MPRQPLIVGNSALIVVDIQRGGALPGKESGSRIMDGSSRADSARRGAAGRRPRRHDPGDLLPGGAPAQRGGLRPRTRRQRGRRTASKATRPTELWPTLRPAEGEYHIVKRRYSGFIGTEFELLLRGLGVSTLILIGGLTDVCVHYTFADAHQRDFYVRVVEDCVGGSSRARHDASLDAMEYLQAGARRSTREILDAFAALSADAAVPASR